MRLLVFMYVHVKVYLCVTVYEHMMVCEDLRNCDFLYFGCEIVCGNIYVCV